MLDVITSNRNQLSYCLSKTTFIVIRHIIHKPTTKMIVRLSVTNSWYLRWKDIVRYLSKLNDMIPRKVTPLRKPFIKTLTNIIVHETSPVLIRKSSNVMLSNLVNMGSIVKKLPQKVYYMKYKRDLILFH